MVTKLEQSERFPAVCKRSPVACFARRSTGMNLLDSMPTQGGMILRARISVVSEAARRTTDQLHPRLARLTQHIAPLPLHRSPSLYLRIASWRGKPLLWTRVTHRLRPRRLLWSFRCSWHHNFQGSRLTNSIDNGVENLYGVFILRAGALHEPRAT